MATLYVWCLISCLFVHFTGITAIDETRYVRAGTDETLSCSMDGTVLNAAWFYCEGCDIDSGAAIYIAVQSDPDTSYPRKDRIAVVYDTDNGLYDLTLLNFNGQTDVGMYTCYINMQDSEYLYCYFTVEFADGPSTASIIGNVPVFADDSNSLPLTCAATANPGVNFQWKNGNNIIGYSNNLILSPAREDNGGTITCTATNSEYVDIRASVSVALEVHYGPDSAVVAGSSTAYADGINTLTFTCTAFLYNPGVSFQWTKGGTRIGDNSDTLTFIPVPADDGKDVICIATNTRHQDEQARDSVAVTVYYGPNSVTITGGPVYADGTNRLTLTCSAEEYNPDVGFQWKEGNQNINGQNTNTYTKIADKTDNGRSLTCLTWNTLYTNTTKETSTQLSVYYGAKDASIQAPSDISEGDDITVICSCHSNPDPTFSITGPTLTSSNGRLEIKNISRTDGGEYSCKAGNCYHMQTITTTVIVNYPPDVTVTFGNATENDTGITITCVAEGNPQSYTFSPWKHITQDGHTIIRELQGVQNEGQLTLTFKDPVYKDSGYYECTVNNGVKRRSPHLDQTKMSTYFIIEVTHTEKEGKLWIIICGTIGVEVAILVCVVVFLFMCRTKLSTKDKLDLEMSNSQRNRKLFDTNPDICDSAENPMYVSSGPSPKPETDIYSEVKQIEKPPPNQDSGEDVYSQVKTKGKAEGDDNVYSQVKKKSAEK